MGTSVTRRVLIVDDDPGAAAGVEVLLEEMGWEVRRAETAKEAYVEFAAFSPDVVLLDVELPDASGIDVLRQLKDDSESTPIIMISGAGTIDRAVESMKLGAETFLQKPFDSDALAIALTQAGKSIATPRALVVDDDPGVAAGLEVLLEEMGWEVRRAETAKQAYVEFAAFSPDVVLLDVELRDASGIDVLRQLKDDSESTPIIMISGAGVVDRVVESMKLGAETFLQKPFDADALAIALKQVAKSIAQGRRPAEAGRREAAAGAQRPFQCTRCHTEIDRAVKACPRCSEPVTDFLRRHYDEPVDGKYRVIERLGAGGMGEVYKVVHTFLGTNRVIKVIRPQMSGSDKAHERFLREARLATKMQHPNLATLYDFSALPDGSHYMVWEFIDGQNLAQVMRWRGVLPMRYAIDLTIQALAGLDAIHRAGIIHRDISPDNLMITRDDEDNARLKIIDFGIAKGGEEDYTATAPGIFIGKLRYASPDQLGFLPKGERIDGRADLYSLAIILYEMLTGRPMFEAASPHQDILRHSRKTPLSPLDLGHIPGGAELQAVLARALQRDRDKRYANAREFAQALEHVKQSLPDTEAAAVAAPPTLRLTPVPSRITLRAKVEEPAPSVQPQTYVDGSSSPSSDEALAFLLQQARGVRRVSLEASGDAALAKQLADLLRKSDLTIADRCDIVIHFNGTLTHVGRGRRRCAAQASVVKAGTVIFRYEFPSKDCRGRDNPAKRFARVLSDAFGK
jgi:DNA-binding response OmpR family regulator/serine/threonine protein kinase